VEQRRRARSWAPRAVGSVAAVLVITGAGLWAQGAASAQGATNLYVATSGSDSGNNCQAQSSPCATISQAVSQASALTGDVSIQVAPGTYSDNVSIGSGSEASLAIKGAGNPTVRPKQANNTPIVSVSSAAPPVSIDGVTLAGVKLSFGGTGISDRGRSLTVTNSTLSNNWNIQQGSGAYGAALSATNNPSGSSLAVSGDTFAGNVAVASNLATGSVAVGAGIYAQDTASLAVSVTDSTFNANSVAGGSYAQGGAVNTSGAGVKTRLFQDTVAGNVANNATVVGGAGVFASFSSTITVESTIFAANNGGSCGSSTLASVADGGHNSEDGPSCGFSLGNDDALNVNPGLGPLQSNGGPTQTMAIGPSSPVYHWIATSSGGCAATDQRGVPRPQPPAPVQGTNPSCDIGAYEYAIPVVTSISPTQGPAGGGTAVTVNGYGFTTATAVSFGSTPASSFSVNSDGSLTAVAPGGGGTVPITVTAPDGTSAATAGGLFNYILGPTITNVSPSAGPIGGGQSVTVTGVDFVPPLSFRFGSAPATSVSCGGSSTECTMLAPAGGTAKTVDVTVSTPGGTSPVTPSDRYSYVPAPTVTSVAPGSGPATGGTPVTVTGSGFSDATAVSFGSVPASFTVSSDGSLIATAPAQPTAGKFDVTVTNPGGTSATSAADQFAYTPSVTGVSPGFGPLEGGNDVEVTGVGFSTAAGATSVSFGGNSASSVSCSSNSSCSAVAPAGTGTVDVTVTVGGETSPTVAADQYEYLDVPLVTGVTPSSGTLEGGTAITISGEGFAPGSTSVKVGPNEASGVNCASSSTCTATTPPGSGVNDVTVTTSSGTSPPNPPDDQFTYRPTVTGVVPSSGPESGGTAVTISGSDFSTSPGGTTVDFGPVAATEVSCSSSTTCTATSPAGTGTVDVTATVAGGTSLGSPADQFTYIPAPVVTAVSPSSGPIAGGTQVTISGSGFTGATAVDFGSVPATTFSVASDASITATAPAGSAPGVLDVTVTAPGGESATSPEDQFSYSLAGAYHPLPPIRVADTRPGSGYPYAGKTLGPGQSLDVSVGAAVPAGSTAVVLNLTEADATQSSYLTVWPAGAARPTASNLNFGPGRVVANLAEVKLGSGNEVSIYNASGRTDVVVDLEGYVGPTTTTAGLFNPLEPARIADTRPASGYPYAGQPIGPGQSLAVQVTGQGGVPSSGVSAVVLNLTEADSTRASYLSAWPSGQARPTASNLNFSPGQVVPNRVVVPVGANGQVSIYNANGVTNLVVDVNGWYTDSSSPGAGDVFEPTAPARIADTRPGSGYPYAGSTLGPGATLPVQVSGVVPVPASADGIVANVTVTNTSASSYLTVFPDGPPRPTASDLNWGAGETVSNLAVVSLGKLDGRVDLYNALGKTDAIVDVAGWYMPAGIAVSAPPSA
jgi:hypothetical protein